MTNVHDLAEMATAAALRVRMNQKLGLYGAICPYDLALDMGLEVRFETISSLEGIYRAGPAPLILLNSLRPPGRRAYTCAHELAHHLFGHGTCVDALLDQADERFEPSEYVADRFASALLLPKVAVSRAFATRGWVVQTCTPIEMYTIAGYFGVGYTTLVGYLENTLAILPTARAQELRRSSPRSIRHALLGTDATAVGVVVVDEQWGGRPIDVEVGDLIMLPPRRRLQGTCVVVESTGAHPIARAVRPGTGVLEAESSSIAVRVCRREYRGLYDYRFEEDPDDQGS